MAIVPSTRQRPPPTDFQVFRLNNPAFVAELPALRKYRDRRLDSLNARSARDQRSFARRVLSDRRLLRLYAYEALRKARELRDASQDQIYEMAEQANLFVPCHERYRTQFVRTRQRQREVFIYGPQRRLRQLLVADVIRAIHPPLDKQLMLRGGMPEARRATDAAYFHHGFRYCAEVDFINFYGSVSHDGLAEILKPLPSAVVDHVVWDMTIRTTNEDDHPSTDLPYSWPYPHRIDIIGLPLGSACSPVVGECLIAQFLREIPDDQFVSYADNILLFGNDEAELQARIENLRHRVQTGIGSMRFRTEEIIRDYGPFEMSAGFEFLGQEVTITTDSENGETSNGFAWSPAERKRREYEIAELDDETLITPLTLAELDATERKVINWRMAYPNWPNGDQFEAQRLAEIAAARYYRTGDQVDLARACQAAISRALYEQGVVSFYNLVPDHNSRPYNRRRTILVEECNRRWTGLINQTDRQAIG